MGVNYHGLHMFCISCYATIQTVSDIFLTQRNFM